MNQLSLACLSSFDYSSWPYSRFRKAFLFSSGSFPDLFGSRRVKNLVKFSICVISFS